MSQKVDKEKLRMAAELCRGMADSFGEAADGKPFSRACTEAGLNWNCCRRLILSKTFQSCTEPTVPLDNAVEIVLDPYERLYRDVFPNFDVWKMDLPFDYVESVIAVLNDLSDREREVTCMRCGIDEDDGRGKTYTAIAEKYGCSPERIRQVYIYALRKLRNPARAQILTRGLCRYQAEKTIAEANAKAREAEIAEETKRLIEKAKDYGENVREADNPINMAVEELGLSVRSSNCLRHAGIRTLRDLLQCPESQLKMVRNLGRKSLEEVIEKRDLMLEQITNYGNVKDHKSE